MVESWWFNQAANRSRVAASTGSTSSIAVGDAALWLCIEHWRDVEWYTLAKQIIELGWHAGSRYPDLAGLVLPQPCSNTSTPRPPPMRSSRAGTGRAAK